MKSITACPHCSTQFLVDDEQLSQYNGKVRCGSCLNVFNAIDYIVPSSQIPETQSQPTGVQQSDTETTASITKESAITDDASEDHSPEHVSINDEMEQAYFEKTQSLIENIDMHNIASESDAVDAKMSAEVDDLAEVPKIPEKPEILEIPEQSFPDTTHDIESVKEPEEAVVQDNIATEKQSTVLDHNLALDQVSNKETGSDLDEFSYSPNLPSREDLSEASQEDLSSEYSIYDLPDEPTFSIDDSMPAPQTNTHDNLLEKTAEPIDAEEVAVDDQTEPFYVKEKQPVSPFLTLLTVIFILVLIGQLVYFLRNTIAQQLPDTKPYLEMLCQPLGCTIDLPKNIQLFSIDDSSIQEDMTHADVIRLTSTITNRAAFNQAFPNLEVTLTDAKDQPKIRRLFKPTEYLPKEIMIDDGISPEDSISIDMPLMTENVKVSGFRILLTY